MPVWATLGAVAIKTGADIYGANKASNASEQASATQAKAAEDALNFSKSVYGDLKAARQPYVNFGTSALGTLAGLAGLPNPMTAGNTGPVNPNIPQGVTGGYPGQTSGVSTGSSTDFVGGAGRPDAAFGGTANPGAPVSPVTSGWAMMEAPDGTRKPIPATLIPYFTGKGAKIVGGAPAQSGGVNDLLVRLGAKGTPNG